MKNVENHYWKAVVNDRQNIENCVVSFVIGSISSGLFLLSYKMSILAHNGGAVVAMTGKNCVAIASDKRFGVGAQTISCNFQFGCQMFQSTSVVLVGESLISVRSPIHLKKIFEMGPHLYVGLPGLATDTQTVYQRLRFRLNLYELKEGRKMAPKTFSHMMSNLLYERRFGPYFVEPVVAGLDAGTGTPFVCNMDLIGCPNMPNNFVVAGTCSEQLYGMCETLWEPDLEPNQLFETISQALVNSCDRDAISGWGANVFVIEPDKVTKRTLKTRMD